MKSFESLENYPLWELDQAGGEWESRVKLGENEKQEASKSQPKHKGVDDHEDDDYPWDDECRDEYDGHDDVGPWGECFVNVLPGSVDDPQPLPAVAKTLKYLTSISWLYFLF